ncbi:NifU family protein [Sphingopyxis fribergensis]
MTPIEFERTPNPDALRVLPGFSLTSGPPRSFDKSNAVHEPLAAALLGIAGIARIMIGADFVTVMREGDRNWDDLKPDIALQLLHHQSALSTQGYDAEPCGIAGSEGFSDVEAHIDAVLERYVRPWLVADGGNALLDRFDAATATAWVRMEGACGGCPSGSITLKKGIETTIRRWVPEVASVQAVGQTPHGDPKARIREWIAGKWPDFRSGAKS